MYTITNTPASIPNCRAMRRSEMRSPVSVNESILIERCKQGDEAAWNLLVRRYQRTIYRYAYELCRNYDEAADVVGQVLLQIYESLYTFRGDGSFSSWLYRIVRNVYLDLNIRPAYRRLDIPLAPPDNSDGCCAELNIADSGPAPEEICLENEAVSEISKAVSELPAYVRRPLKLRASGASYSEIAERTGLNIGTVKSRLSRGRLMLRDRLPRFDERLKVN